MQNTDKDLLSSSRLKLGGTFYCKQYNADGVLVDEWEAKNVVTDEGVNYALDAALSGGTPITTWYVGLKNTGSEAIGDTATGIGTTTAWTENTTYTGNRPGWTEAGVSAKSITNSASPASFAITGTTTVFGAFIISTNTGASGTLFAVADFASSKSLNNGDTLEVTYAISGADDGV